MCQTSPEPVTALWASQLGAGMVHVGPRLARLLGGQCPAAPRRADLTGRLGRPRGTGTVCTNVSVVTPQIYRFDGVTGSLLQTFPFFLIVHFPYIKS